ncbi:GSCFA domain-containing protein [Lentibacter sp. XHP0401]|uniref:GSCFA domain-containing protein n=1 Tax=Lentibacter sp. XHP0401 TaxID=2984334 RepID=UPI0021E80EF2|nr:GSCFA domain-containing protein [Lentibacter sp. XHP0401]MCV2893916.1 GSCFA domain-containing protein [Lentibacter sp. XHP0401]
MSDTPYSSQPPKAFWRTGVADAGIYGYEGLFRSKWKLPANAAFATYGSCFAQHISRAVQANGKPWVNAEPAPASASASVASKFGYGVYSSRTANIYTARMLELWVALAIKPKRCDSIEIWEDAAGRFRDSLRPTIEPDGFASHEDCIEMLKATARAFRRSAREAQVFVFTMGLTEGFENAVTGQPYALCPGTLAGTYDAAQHRFINYRYPQILKSMKTAIQGLRAINPSLKFLLTVSPVPLTATATDDHVLLATQYSKSVLRAVAGDLAEVAADIDYFPSYEIIASPPTRGQFFAPNMRSVEPDGVALVMEHFFKGMRFSKKQLADNAAETARRASITAETEADDLACEEILLDQGARS